MAPPTDGGFHQVQADQKVVHHQPFPLQGPAGLTFCRFFCFLRCVFQGWRRTDDQDRPKRGTVESLSGASKAVVRDCSSLCPCRETLLLTPSTPGRFFVSRSEALTKAFLLTPRDVDVSGA
jgi:hypothetical protein